MSEIGKPNKKIRVVDEGCLGMAYYSALMDSRELPGPIEDLGVSIEPIVGWREWAVEQDGKEYWLESRNRVTWPPYAPMIAICNEDLMADHDAPQEDCDCGIYAWDESFKPSYGNNQVYGEVNLWGDVLICDKGYRAEFAYPKRLYMIDNGTKIRKRVAQILVETYGVPVELLDSPVAPEELA